MKSGFAWFLAWKLMNKRHFHRKFALFPDYFSSLFLLDSFCQFLPPFSRLCQFCLWPRPMIFYLAYLAFSWGYFNTVVGQSVIWLFFFLGSEKFLLSCIVYSRKMIYITNMWVCGLSVPAMMMTSFFLDLLYIFFLKNSFFLSVFCASTTKNGNRRAKIKYKNFLYCLPCSAVSRACEP